MTTDPAAEDFGPLERKHLQYANFRAVAGGTEVTKTHWHIALANGLGWGFDGMDSMVFSLVAPLVITEFALDLPSYRSGMQIALFVGIAGLYFWPWLADRYGQRNFLAINIALFSLLMPVVALAPSFAVFVVGPSVVNFALNGEWSLGSLLVVETWPARLRGRVININRATWCFGVSLAGVISGVAAAFWGWRLAVMLPAVIALLAIYVRATCPESPYWVRAQDRKRRIAETLSASRAVNEDDRAWYAKAGSVGIRQVFMPDALVFPTRIRGAANGVVWTIAYFVGFVLWPFVTVALQQSTGSFALAFLCIPVHSCHDDRDGGRRLAVGTRTCRPGTQYHHRVRRRETSSHRGSGPLGNRFSQWRAMSTRGAIHAAPLSAICRNIRSSAPIRPGRPIMRR
jgi:MFS family permease